MNLIWQEDKVLSFPIYIMCVVCVVCAVCMFNIAVFYRDRYCNWYIAGRVCTASRLDK